MLQFIRKRWEKHDNPNFLKLTSRRLRIKSWILNILLNKTGMHDQLTLFIMLHELALSHHGTFSRFLLVETVSIFNREMLKIDEDNMQDAN